VPDYVAFFEDFADPNLAYFAKENNTKLQFKFEKTNDSRYPFGANFTYRAFASASVILIVKKELIPFLKLNETGRNLGLQAIEVEIPQQPAHKITGALTPRHCLLNLPTKPIVPSALVEKSRANLDAVVQFVKNKFGEGLPYP